MRTILMSLFLATEKNQNCFSEYACIALRSKHTKASWEKEAMETEAQVSDQSLPQNTILFIAVAIVNLLAWEGQAGREALLYPTLQKRQVSA